MAISEKILGAPVSELIAAGKAPQRLENSQDSATEKAQQGKLYFAWSLSAHLFFTHTE